MSAVAYLKAVQEAEEIYYLANGEYAFDLDALATESSCQKLSADDGSTYTCDAYFDIDVIGEVQANATANHLYLDAYYCPSIANNHTRVSQCKSAAEFTYRVWLDNSPNPGTITCTGSTTLGQKICTNP